MRILHAGADLLRRGHARGSQSRIPQSRHPGSQQSAAFGRRRDPRAHERQYLPLRRLSQHRGGHQTGRRDRMTPFTYERVGSPAEAAKAVAARPGAKFIGGGTNLLDLMKLEVETPTHLVDVNHIGLDKIEETSDGGL